MPLGALKGEIYRASRLEGRWEKAEDNPCSSGCGVLSGYGRSQ